MHMHLIRFGIQPNSGTDSCCLWIHGSHDYISCVSLLDPTLVRPTHQVVYEECGDESRRCVRQSIDHDEIETFRLATIFDVNCFCMEATFIRQKHRKPTYASGLIFIS